MVIHIHVAPRPVTVPYMSCRYCIAAGHRPTSRTMVKVSQKALIISNGKLPRRSREGAAVDVIGAPIGNLCYLLNGRNYTHCPFSVRSSVLGVTSRHISLSYYNLFRGLCINMIDHDSEVIFFII